MQDSLLKQCTKCGKFKPLDCFNKNNKSKDGLKSWCRDCTKADYEQHKEQYKQYREEHKDVRNKQHKLWYKDNRTHCISYGKDYYSQNTEQCKKVSHNYVNPNWGLDYYNQNKLRFNFHKSVVRSLLSSQTKEQYIYYNTLPYNKEQLKEHLESQFTPEMSWDNYGTYWELDHIIPQNVFDLSDIHSKDFQICWSLMNLRPLTIKENRSRPKDGSDISEEVRNKILNQN